MDQEALLLALRAHPRYRGPVAGGMPTDNQGNEISEEEDNLRKYGDPNASSDEEAQANRESQDSGDGGGDSGGGGGGDSGGGGGGQEVYGQTYDQQTPETKAMFESVYGSDAQQAWEQERASSQAAADW